jgi:hypothetical protein
MRFCLSVSLLLLAAAAYAVEENTLPGSRPIGMGDAFTATADDANSVRRNPAGLPRLGVYAFELERTPGRLFGQLETNYLSAVVPISDKSAFGADWVDVGINDDELNAGRSHFNFSYGYLPSRHVSLGVNLKYFTQSVSLDNESRGAANGWGTDVGIIVRPTHRWSVGLLAQDLVGFGSGEGLVRGRWIRHHPDVSEEISFTVYRFGVAYRPTSRWLFGADLTDRFHFGAEFLPNTNLAVRAGFQKDLETDEAPTYSLGGSVKFRWLNFNTAYLMPPTLPATIYAGLSFNFDYRKLPVRIEYIRIEDLYPVHYHYYATPNRESQPITYDEPDAPPLLTEVDRDRYYPLTSSDTIGRIWLKNESHEPVTVHIKLFMDGFVSRDGTEVALGDIELPPRKRKSVPIRQLVLTSSAVELSQAQPVQAEIKVIETGGAAYKTATTTVTLHDIHTTVLDDVGKLGSFVISEDPTVAAFTEAVFAEFAQEIEDIEQTGIPLGLYRAMLLFNALHGIAYKSDPNIPFASGTNDDIKYPHEMLMHLTEQTSEVGNSGVFGDCDDSTALYCSLLESVGIETALIQLPSHVMMAFRLGKISIDQAQRVNLPYYTPINGQVWIPVETTLIKDGFVAAWKKGFDEIQGAGVGHSTTTVEEAWEKYGISPIRGSKQPFSIPKELTLDKVQSDLASPWLQGFLKAHLNIGIQE